MANRRRRQRVFFWLGAGCAAAGFLFPSAASSGSRGATAACDPPVVSAVACENTKAGNPSSEWDVAGAGDAGIQGFATDISVDQGETVRFKVDTAASDYRLDIYRLGYYAGLGARKVATVQPSASLPQTQPACAQEAATGLVDCGNWGESASWAAPADAVSGIYLAKLVREDGPSGASHIVFVVRDDDGRSELLFQTSDTTWQAYNTYGGNSFYTGSPAGRAYKVSYNRPVTTRGGYPEDSVFNAEYPMVRWLEANGYDVSYSTGVDSDRRGGELLEHKAFLSVGHDEYWSGVQRANVEAARSAGTNLAFFSGNEIFWKTRWENSIDGLGTPYRTLVCYKETHAGAKIDPTPAWTGTWRDPRFSPPADGGRPENALSGTIFLVNGGGGGSIVVPAADGKMRFWRNTSVATLGPAASATLPDGTLGYEYDEDRDNGARPPGLFRLSSATLTNQPILLDYGSTYGSGTATHHLTMYRAASGALVFGAGTIQWSWGLDSNHDRGSAPADPRMQQATVNLFADMGAQPATLQAGLVAAAASTDTVAPTTQITSPPDGSTVNAGATVTISGTAADTGGGVVGGVEVSVDGGSTWHPATGRESWSYSWTPQATGPAALKSRAVDDSGNLGGVSTINVTVAAQSCPCSIWSSSTVPGGDGGDVNAVEVGVRFRSDVAGFITGIRFHKQSLNTGTHVGRLWSNSGGPALAEVTFTSESASGWQEASFASPVAISANTTYLASYHTSAGHYSFNGAYFTSPTDNPPLHALQNGVDGANGVYKYGPGGTFPTDTYNAGNYWVDVVFSTTATDTDPPTVSSVTPASGATGVPTASNVSVSFSEPIDPSTITGSTFELRQGASLVAASVSYDAGTRTATLDPTGPLANSTSYTATVKGGAAGVKDSAGNPLAADYSWTFTTAAAPPSGFTDTTVADFSAGTPDAAVTVVETADGELILTPTAGSEFSGSALPAGWETTLWDASGSATVGSGRLTLDAARVGTSALYDPGRTLEFVATFGAQAYEHVGFGVDYNNTPYWAMFSTFNGGGGLYARTNNNGSTVDTLIAGSLVGSSHRYRIDWLADSVVFSVDGTVVHTQPAAIAAQMRPLASDYLPGGATLSLDWLRLSPYASPGSFLSRIFDAGSSVSWGAFSWNGQTPAGSTLRLYVRTGNTPTPDGSWSEFTELPSSGASVARSSRYLQYRADLASSDPAQTPVLESVSATYTSGGPTAVAVRSFSAHRLRPTGVRLQWRTASELGTVGFNLWRSRVGRAGFRKLNAALIPARRAGSSAGYRYRYLDRTASRLGYRYRLELVRLDGSRVWAGQSAVATPTN